MAELEADQAATVMERCELLGGISEEPDLLVRPYSANVGRWRKAI